MRPLLVVLLVVLTSSFSLYAWGTPATDAPQTTPLHFNPCSLSSSNGGSLNAECARWQQPLDRSDPDGKQIELFIARLPSTAVEPAADAFTVINGGPGGSSIDLLVDFAQVVQPITRKRDVIVIDQRGTGRSAPLNCEALTDSVDIPDPSEVIALTRECLNSLAYDPRYFSTSAAVEDIEALRQILGYQQLSVYGVSYGTRVAMQYMRRHGAYTRAVVIDGVLPPQQILDHSTILHSHNSLQAVFARCATETACQAQFPDLQADFVSLSARLKAATIPLQLPHPVTGLPTKLDFGYDHLSFWLRFALYAPETIALVPLVIHQAHAQENYLPIVADGLRLVHEFDNSLNYGMYNAVVCTEDTPFFADQEVDYAALDATFMGRQMYDILDAMCSVWPSGMMHEDMKAALQSDVPTLVLSGEFDPITPPSWGAQVLPGLSRAKHVVAPGQSHGVLGRGCIPKLILDFVESADIDKVDESCTRFLIPHPFFVDLMGPQP